jgi:hypothetical protein
MVLEQVEVEEAHRIAMSDLVDLFVGQVSDREFYPIYGYITDRLGSTTVVIEADEWACVRSGDVRLHRGRSLKQGR